MSDDGSRIDHTLTTDNFHEIVTTAVYRNVALRTLKIAVLVTVIDMVLALPIAFYMAKIASARWRGLLLAAVLVPLWGSYLVKAFAWRAIVGEPGGVLDWISPSLSPGYGQVALVIVLAYLWLPFMIVPVYSGLERLPDSLLDASSDLGARFGTTFVRVVVPTAAALDRRRIGLHVLAVARRLHRGRSRRRQDPDDRIDRVRATSPRTCRSPRPTRWCRS